MRFFDASGDGARSASMRAFESTMAAVRAFEPTIAADICGRGCPYSRLDL